MSKYEAYNPLRHGTTDYGYRSIFTGDRELPATCAFCGTATRTVQGRYVWHAFHGFSCAACGMTPERAAAIELDASGRLVNVNEMALYAEVV